MTRRRLAWTLVAAGLLCAPAFAQTTISFGELACLPHNANQAVTARVTPDLPGATVRLYFRRLNNEVEDFYWTEMRPAGDGSYWGVFPVPTDDKPIRKDLKKDLPPGSDPNTRWAQWWKRKDTLDSRDPNDDLSKQVIRERAQVGKNQKRGWLATRPDADLQNWLVKQDFEPAEYYAAVFDAKGQLVATSPMQVVAVQKSCDVNLNPQQASYAANLTVGETATWQKGEKLFHWQCHGIVTRVNPFGIYRADEFCRVCAVAWWKTGAPIIATAGVVGVVAIEPGPKKPVSPSRP